MPRMASVTGLGTVGHPFVVEASTYAEAAAAALAHARKTFDRDATLSEPQKLERRGVELELRVLRAPSGMRRTLFFEMRATRRASGVRPAAQR